MRNFYPPPPESLMAKIAIPRHAPLRVPAFLYLSFLLDGVAARWQRTALGDHLLTYFKL